MFIRLPSNNYLLEHEHSKKIKIYSGVPNSDYEVSNPCDNDRLIRDKKLRMMFHLDKNLREMCDLSANRTVITEELIKRGINSESPMADVRQKYLSYLTTFLLTYLYEVYKITPSLYLNKDYFLTFDVTYLQFIRPLIIAYEADQAANILGTLSVNDAK